MLRAYQQELVDRFEASAARRSLVVLPTGAGKTHVAVEVIRRTVARGGRVLVVAHRVELLDQMRAHVDALDRVVVTSVLKAKREDGPFDLVVIDEAHHAAARTYVAILESYPDARVMGLTATPARLDGKPLDMFDEILEGPPSEELVAAGHLAEVRYFAPDAGAARALVDGVRQTAGDFDRAAIGTRSIAPELVGGIVDHWFSHAKGLQTIVFAVTIRHAQAIARKFRVRGVAVEVISGDTPEGQRQRMLADFRSAAVTVLVNVELFGEGLDVPNVRCVVQARPTMSLTLFRQQCGRAMRPGNVRPIVLDHAGNVWRHGVPTAPVPWSLEGRIRPEAGGVVVRRCACGSVSPRVDGACPECGATIERAERMDPEENERARLMELAKVGAVTCAGGCGKRPSPFAFSRAHVIRRKGKPWICQKCHAATVPMEMRLEWGRKGAMQQLATMTPEQRRENIRAAREASASIPFEKRSESMRRAWKTLTSDKRSTRSARIAASIANQTPQQRKERTAKAAAVRAERLAKSDPERSDLLKMAKAGEIACAGGCGKKPPTDAFCPKAIAHRNGAPWMCLSCANKKSGASRRGRKASPETRAKLSAAMHTRWRTPEAREEAAAKMRRRMQDPDARAKVGARLHAAEVCEKRTAAIRAHHAAKRAAKAAAAEAPPTEAADPEAAQ